jgi:hypothetical protein
MPTPQDDQVFLDKPWVRTWWDEAHKCVHAEFKSFVNNADFRSCTLGIVDAIKDVSSDSLISDNRRLEGVTVEDQLWLRDTWTPLAVDAGLRRIAVVLARQGMGKIASEAIIGRFGDRTFLTRTFDSIDAAQKWIGERSPQTLHEA